MLFISVFSFIFFFFFFNDTATTEIYTLSLHDALPICLAQERAPVHGVLALEVRQHRVHGVAAFVHGGTVGLGHVVAQRLAQALRGQLVGVKLAGGGVGADLLVHQRLGQGQWVLVYLGTPSV